MSQGKSTVDKFLSVEDDRIIRVRPEMPNLQAFHFWVKSATYEAQINDYPGETEETMIRII